RGGGTPPLDRLMNVECASAKHSSERGKSAGAGAAAVRDHAAQRCAAGGVTLAAAAGAAAPSAGHAVGAAAVARLVGAIETGGAPVAGCRRADEVAAGRRLVIVQREVARSLQILIAEQRAVFVGAALRAHGAVGIIVVAHPQSRVVQEDGVG